MEQTSLIPGEEELKKLTRERDELKSRVKPLLDLVKGNAQFLVKYAPFCEAVFYRSNHLLAAASNTAIAIDQAQELSNATAKLGACLVRYSQVTEELDSLKEQLNRQTNGEYRRSHPELWDESPEQLEEQADAILEANGLDAETAEPTQTDEVDEFGHPIFRGDSNPEVAPTDHGELVAEDGTVALSAEDQNPATAI